MKYLIIDTSGSESFVLLSGTSTNVTTLPSARGQTKYLIPAIDQLLKEANLSLADLSFIAVGNGPGSFTGTRIGVITAKTLAYASKLPLLSFCSLMRYIPNETQDYLILSDAKSRGYYAMNSSLEPFLIAKDQLPPKTKHTYLASSSETNYENLSEILKKQCTKGFFVAPEELKVTYLTT